MLGDCVLLSQSRCILHAENTRQVIFSIRISINGISNSKQFLHKGYHAVQRPTALEHRNSLPSTGKSCLSRVTTTGRSMSKLSLDQEVEMLIVVRC